MTSFSRAIAMCVQNSLFLESKPVPFQLFNNFLFPYYCTVKLMLKSKILLFCGSLYFSSTYFLCMILIFLSTLATFVLLICHSVSFIPLLFYFLLIYSLGVPVLFLSSLRVSLLLLSSFYPNQLCIKSNCSHCEHQIFTEKIKYAGTGQRAVQR